jgi:hypothetical protein
MLNLKTAMFPEDFLATGFITYFTCKILTILYYQEMLLRTQKRNGDSETNRS